MNTTLLVMDCGVQPYVETWKLQHHLVAARTEGRIPDVLLLVEHLPVITLGRKGSLESMKVSKEFLDGKGISFFVVERGGDATFHCPGQIVGYPIFRIPGEGRRVRAFVESLEKVMTRVLLEFGVPGQSHLDGPGVWVKNAKIGSLGITIHNQVSFHGFALNVNNDLSGFDLIHPCGMKNCRVTSLKDCLGKEVPMETVKQSLINHCTVVFDRRVTCIGNQAEAMCKACITRNAVTDSP